MRIIIRNVQPNDERRVEEEPKRLFTPFPVIPWPIGLRERLRLDSEGSLMPEVDVKDEGDIVAVTAKVPDIDVEDIEVYVSANMVSILGKSDHSNSYRDKRHFRSERSYGRFQRDIYVPVEVDPTTAEAKYDNGVLTIHLRKATTKNR